MINDRLYHYRGFVRSVYDGDTVRADIDLGMNLVVRNEPLRLSRINAPEVRGEERDQGLAAAAYLRKRIEGRDVLVQTLKDEKGKFGRYIVEIWLEENGATININDEMVAKGYAAYRSY